MIFRFINWITWLDAKKKILGSWRILFIKCKLKKYLGNEKKNVRCKQEEKKFVVKKMLFYKQRKWKRDKVVTQIHNHQM